MSGTSRQRSSSVIDYESMVCSEEEQLQSVDNSALLCLMDEESSASSSWLDGLMSSSEPATWAEPGQSLSGLSPEELVCSPDTPFTPAQLTEAENDPRVLEAETPEEANQYVIQLLVGGAFTDGSGTEHPFGHTAVRLIDEAGGADMIYDFGRYGRTNGDFSAEGEGILRKWDGAFDEYMDGQNAKGRETYGFSFPVSEEQYQAALAYATSLEEGSSDYRGDRTFPGGGNRDVLKLANDYHGLTNNCTTLSVDIAEAGMPGVDFDVSAQNEGRGLGLHHRAAANLAGWPDDIFMPADLGAVLQDMGQGSDDMWIEHWDPMSETPYRMVKPPGEPASDSRP